MDVENDRFQIGYNLSNLFKYLFRVTALSYIVLGSIILIVLIFLALITLEPFFLLLIPVSIIGIVLITAPFMVLIVVLILFLQFSLISTRCTNYVKLKKTRMRIVKQAGPRSPIFSIEIPYSIISRGNKFDDETFQKWRKNSHFIHKLTGSYTLPHGSMHVPMTGRENLIIIYLKKSVKLRNHDLANPWAKYPITRTKRVKMVIIDIEVRRQEEFLDRLDEKIVMAKVRMMDLKGRKMTKAPMMAKVPPTY